MDIDLEALTLMALLTTTGAGTLAVFVTGFVSMLKGFVRPVAANPAGAAAVITAIIVLLLAVQAVQLGAIEVGVPLIFAVVFAWYGVTRLSMAVYDDVTNKAASLRAQV